jgi:hypothetical protein
MVSRLFDSVLGMSLLASALLAAAPASAGLSYSGIFTAPAPCGAPCSEPIPGPGSGGDGSGSYYRDDHEASQTFSATGLTEVSSLQLTLRLADPDHSSNQLIEPLTFSFQLNGTTVGSTLYQPLGGHDEYDPRHLDFDFAPLFNAAGDWTLRMWVSKAGTSATPGNIRLSSNNPFEISIPEPSGLALVALGLVAAGLFYRRR